MQYTVEKKIFSRSPDESPPSPEKYHLCSRHCSCHKTIYLSFLHSCNPSFSFPCSLSASFSTLCLSSHWIDGSAKHVSEELLTHSSLTRSLIPCPSRSHLPLRTVSTLCVTKAIYLPARLSVAEVQTRISGNRAASRTHSTPSPWQQLVSHPTTPRPSVLDLQSYPQLKDTDRSVGWDMSGISFYPDWICSLWGRLKACACFFLWLL